MKRFSVYLVRDSWTVHDRNVKVTCDKSLIVLEFNFEVRKESIIFSEQILLIIFTPKAWYHITYLGLMFLNTIVWLDDNRYEVIRSPICVGTPKFILNCIFFHLYFLLFVFSLYFLHLYFICIFFYLSDLPY